MVVNLDSTNQHMPSAQLIDAAAASRRLGVAKASLYAYVSRGLLRAYPDPADPRARRYATSEIEALCERRYRTRKPTQDLLDEYALAALDKARPIVRTSLTRLVDGVPHYRGRNALELARSSSVEAAARWLWKFDPESNPAASDPFKGRAPSVPVAWAGLRDETADWPLTEKVLARFAMAQQAAPAPAWLSSPNALAPVCGQQLRLLTACFLGTAPSKQPLPRQIAKAWGLSRAAEDAVRECMILLADHLISPMTFTSRVVVSIGAGLGPAILAGLCTMSGQFTAGQTGEVERWWDELAQRDDINTAVAERLASGSWPPGFNHPYYPGIDPRAQRILQLSAELAQPAAVLKAVARVSDLRPTIDFALVALRRAIRAPQEAASVLLFLSRSIGIIAHVLEQRRSGRRMLTGSQFEPEPSET
jgi:citrate synthase